MRCKRGVRVGGESEVQERGESVRCDSTVRCECEVREQCEVRWESRVRV